jgi:hypothetical protein
MKTELYTEITIFSLCTFRKKVCYTYDAEAM